MTRFVPKRKAAPLSRVLPRLSVCLLAGVAVPGCVNPAEPLPVILWEADLVPEGGGASIFLVGQAAMVANQIDSQIGIGISVLDSGVSPRWRVRQGSCQSPGQAVATDEFFPTLLPNSEGDANAEIRIFQRLPPERSYMAEVFLVEGGSESRMACGEMARAN